MTLREKIKQFSTASMAQLFRQFRAGVIYFSVGGIMIYLANTALEPSLRQEIVALAGVVLLVIGFVIAISAQFRMVLSRIYHFFKRRN